MPVPRSGLRTMVDYVYDHLSDLERSLIGPNPLSESDLVRYARVDGLSYVVVLDYRDERFRREHPVSGFVANVASVATSRGRGATDRLVGKMLEDVSGKIVAEVHVDNIHGKKLVERNGFKPCARRRDVLYYVAGE